MGRHSLPDGVEPDRTGGRRPGARRRTVVISAVLVLAVAAGTVVALRGGLLPFGAACGGESVRLDVVASPDIAPALQAVAAEARKDGTRTDGKCLEVAITARNGAEVADSLGQRPARSPFQVWIPDSTLWADRVGAESGTPLTASGTIASSPIALGAVPSAADALGWPEKTYSWARLTRAASGSGALRLGVADPARSATGLLALARIDASHEGEGAREGASGTRTAAAAKALYQRVAESDGQALATLPHDASAAERGNPRRNQALLLSEQAAYRHNRAAGGAPELRLFHPSDGTARLDYPYTLIDEEELTADQLRAASRFMTLLDSDEGQRVLRTHGFRAANGQPDARVTRTAGGRDPQPPATDLTDPPSVKETQALLGMWTITVQSTRITTVVDASASMAEPVPGRGGQTRMDLARASLLQALATFTPQDEIGLWKFATFLDGDRDHLTLSPTARLGDRGAYGGTHRDELAAAFGALAPVPGGGTGLYDTTLAAYEEATAHVAQGKFNALVVVTDGANDDTGGTSLPALTGKLRALAGARGQVPVIGIAIGPDADKSALDRIAEATGGSAHRVGDPSQIHQVILKAIIAAGGQGPR